MSNEATDNLHTLQDRRRLSRAGYSAFVVVLAIVAGWSALRVDPFNDAAAGHLASADALVAAPVTTFSEWFSPTAPSVPSTWLAELGMRAIRDLDGLTAAVLAVALARAGFVVLLAAACWRAEAALPARVRFVPPVQLSDHLGLGRRTPLSVAAVCTAIGTLLTLPRLSFAPISSAALLIGLAGVLLIRDRSRGERTVTAWLVPIVSLLAINVHPLALLIPMMVLAIVVAAIWERLRVTEQPERPEADRRICRSSRLLLATIAACCATPALPETIAQFQSLVVEAIDPIRRAFQLGWTTGPAAMLCLAGVVLALGVFVVIRGWLRMLRLGECLITLLATVVCWRDPSNWPVAVPLLMPWVAVFAGKMAWPRYPHRFARAALAGTATATAAIAVGLMLIPAVARKTEEHPARQIGSARAATRPAADAIPASDHVLPQVTGLDRN